MDPIRTLSEQCNEVVSELDYRETRIVAQLGASNGIGRAATLQKEEHAVAELKSRSGPTVVHPGSLCAESRLLDVPASSGVETMAKERLSSGACLSTFQLAFIWERAPHVATTHAAQYTLIV